MNPVIRVTAAILAGIVAAGGIIATVEAVGHGAANSGATPFVSALAGYALGTVAGSAIATRIAGQGIAGVCVALALALLAAANLFAIPHPGWFAPTAALLFLGGGWAGIRIGHRGAKR